MTDPGAAHDEYRRANGREEAKTQAKKKWRNEHA